MVSLDQTSISICMSTVNHGLFGSMIFMEDSSLDSMRARGVKLEI